MTHLIVVGILVLCTLIFQLTTELLGRLKKPTPLQIWSANNNLLTEDEFQSKVKEMFDLLNKTYYRRRKKQTSPDKSKKIVDSLESEFTHLIRGLRESMKNNDNKLQDDILSKFHQFTLATFNTCKGDDEQIVLTIVFPIELIHKIIIDSKKLGYTKLSTKAEAIANQIAKSNLKEV